MDVYRALSTRRSVRGFLDKPIAPETLRRIFGAAQRAPSWCNIQPWQVWLTSGETTQKLKDALTGAAQSAMPNPDFEWPPEYPDHYGQLRRDCGRALYEAMGIAREDKEARYGAWLRNYVAFDAPHIAIVGIDQRFGLYAALDVGCWLQSVLLAITAEGGSTCAQAALAAYPDAARAVLDIPASFKLLFGIAIGYEDPSVPANACRTDRQPMDDNVRFL